MGNKYQEVKKKERELDRTAENLPDRICGRKRAERVQKVTAEDGEQPRMTLCARFCRL